jgi:hypothetical protein
VAALVKIRGEIIETSAQDAAPKAVQDTTITKHTFQHRSSFPDRMALKELR